MQLFYSSELNSSVTDYTFPKDESLHIVKVLRKQIGDHLQITNGKGYTFNSIITEANFKKCRVTIESSSFQNPRTYKLHLAVAPTKMNDRFEWFLEKATEIGVQTITPILCDRSERKTIKYERYKKILLSAMKQSKQSYLPMLNPIISFDSFMKKPHFNQRFIAYCGELKKVSLKSVLKSNQDTLILIGPEGDFSVKEIEMALAHHFIPVTLGETRLRTETASVVACHSVVFINE